MVENGSGACKNPWRQARGKRFPVWFCWLLRGEMYPAGRRGPWWGKIPQADGGGRAAPDPGLRGRWVQGLSRRVDTLSSLSPMRSVK
jgi:hypothetical protein